MTFHSKFAVEGRPGGLLRRCCGVGWFGPFFTLIIIHLVNRAVQRSPFQLYSKHLTAVQAAVRNHEKAFVLF